jgi:hypothetical protein
MNQPQKRNRLNTTVQLWKSILSALGGEAPQKRVSRGGGCRTAGGQQVLCDLRDGQVQLGVTRQGAGPVGSGRLDGRHNRTVPNRAPLAAPANHGWVTYLVRHVLAHLWKDKASDGQKRLVVRVCTHCPLSHMLQGRNLSSRLHISGLFEE